MKVAFPLNRILHNQRTEKEYEYFLTIMIFGFTFYTNFGLIFYFTYFKVQKKCVDIDFIVFKISDLV